MTRLDVRCPRGGLYVIAFAEKTTADKVAKQVELGSTEFVCIDDIQVTPFLDRRPCDAYPFGTDFFDPSAATRLHCTLQSLIDLVAYSCTVAGARKPLIGSTSSAMVSISCGTRSKAILECPAVATQRSKRSPVNARSPGESCGSCRTTVMEFSPRAQASAALACARSVA